jgi:hypothetical protein
MASPNAGVICTEQQIKFGRITAHKVDRLGHRVVVFRAKQVPLVIVSKGVKIVRTGPSV